MRSFLKITLQPFKSTSPHEGIAVYQCNELPGGGSRSNIVCGAKPKVPLRTDHLYGDRTALSKLL